MHCYETQCNLQKNAASIITYKLIITYVSLCFRNTVEDAAVVSEGTELVVGREQRVTTRRT